jgi:ribosomal protein S19
MVCFRRRKIRKSVILASRNLIGAHGFKPEMDWGKGYIEVSLSRAMVDFMLNELNLTKFMQQLEAKSYGIDEIMIPTLQVTDALDIPGGFTHACIDRGVKIQHITR